MYCMLGRYNIMIYLLAALRFIDSKDVSKSVKDVSSVIKLSAYSSKRYSKTNKPNLSQHC